MKDWDYNISSAASTAKGEMFQFCSSRGYVFCSSSGEVFASLGIKKKCSQIERKTFFNQFSTACAEKTTEPVFPKIENYQ